MKSLKTLMYNGIKYFSAFVHSSLWQVCAAAASPLNYRYSTWKFKTYVQVSDA